MVGALILGLTEIHDKGRFGKKSLLYSTLALTFWSTRWSFEYTISQSGKDGLQTAAVIAAVLAPICAMQAAVFKFYLNDSADARAKPPNADSF